MRMLEIDSVPRKTVFRVFLLLMLLLVGGRQPHESNSDRPSSRKFEDPPPPTLNLLSSVVVPPLRPNSDVRFHIKPKPLPPGAVTHDWTSFLGPTHNAVSSETKLLTKWPESGPSL